MKRGLSVLLAVALAISAMVFFSGCSNSAQTTGSKEKVLVYGAEFEYDKINPVLGTNNVDNLIFTGLTNFDQNNQVVPDLATKWEISNDQLTYTFHLRQNVKWHDGQPFTADDVVFTLGKILDPKTNSEIAQDYEQIKDVAKIDDYTVKVTLKKPFPPLLEKMAVGTVPKHLLDGKEISNDGFNANPVGTGPFKFQEWKKGVSFTAVANDAYYGGCPKLDKVIFKFLPDPNVRLVQLQTGEVDLAFVEPEQVARVQQMSNVKLYQLPSADYRCMMYNFHDPLWQDVRVRQALNYAVDRQAIVDGVLLGKGKVAYGPLQKSWANNPDVEKYDYNPDKAKALLAEAGWKPGSDGILVKNGKKFSFKLTCPITDPPRVAIASALATDFKKIGIDVTPEPLDWSVIDIAKTQAFVLGWGSPFDPDDHTFKLFTSGAIGLGSTDGNLGAYRNSDIDRLLELARTTSDQNQRKQYYADFQRVLAGDPPYNFIAYVDAMYGVNSQVTGFKTRVLGHHGAGFLWNIKEWDKAD